MNVIKITTETGFSWVTNANGTQEELDRYFVGQRFDIGNYPKEKMEVVVKVEILREVKGNE